MNEDDAEAARWYDSAVRFREEVKRRKASEAALRRAKSDLALVEGQAARLRVSLTTVHQLLADLTEIGPQGIVEQAIWPSEILAVLTETSIR